MFSRRELEALLQCTERALKDLRERIGNYKYLRGKVGRSEVRLVYKVFNSSGEYVVLIKYKNGEVWVEGPKFIAIPLKNKVNSLLKRSLGL